MSAIARKHRTKTLLVGWLFLLPALISFTLFKYYPIILGVFASLFKVDIVNLPGEFIGLENYARALRDNFFHNALKNNVEFFLIGLVMAFWMPIFLATLINEVRKGKLFLRTVYYLPAIAPGIAMMVLWKYIWQPDYGLANYIMRILGQPHQLWLNDANLVKWCMWFPSLLMGGGMNMLIYLAALQEIPEEQHESALIDGAGFFRRIWNISIPQIRGIISVMFVLSIIYCFNMFDNVQVMTGGGPAGATDTIILYAFRQARTNLDYGYSLSMSTLSFIIVLTLTAIQMHLDRDRDAEAAKREQRKHVKRLAAVKAGKGGV